MDSKSVYRCDGSESFPGRRGYEFTFQFFSNEEIFWQQKEEVLS